MALPTVAEKRKTIVEMLNEALKNALIKADCTGSGIDAERWHSTAKEIVRSLKEIALKN